MKDNIILLLFSIVLLTGVWQCVNTPVIKTIKLQDEIAQDVNAGIKHYNRHWNKKNIDTLIKVLYIGQKEYSIDYKKVLGIIAIESNFKIKAINRNKHYKYGRVQYSYDYGLTQINGPNWDWLTRQSHVILTKYNIKHDKYYKYDLATNVMNCYVYLNHARNTLNKKGYFRLDKWIMSYNVGVTGSLTSYSKYVKRRNKYYNKYNHVQETIFN